MNTYNYCFRFDGVNTWITIEIHSDNEATAEEAAKHIGEKLGVDYWYLTRVSEGTEE